MRRIKFYNILFACTISIIGLCACSNEETYDIEGNDGFVYVNELKGFPLCLDQRSIKQTYSGVVGEVAVKFPIKCTMPANKVTIVHLDVDNDYVEEYNTQNGTGYLAIDKNYVTLDNQDLTIEKGEVKSADSLTLSIAKEDMSSLEPGNYLIPIGIITTEGLPRTETFRRVYHLTLNVKFQNIQFSTEEEMNNSATLVTDKSGWSIKYVGQNTMRNPERLIDGNANTSSYARWSSGDYLELDLGEVHNAIMGLYLNFAYYYYGWNDIKISVSEDGSTWTDMGDDSIGSSAQVRVIEFLSPAKARYIRFEPNTRPSQWGSYINIREVSIYE